MRALRRAWRLARVVLHGLHGVGIVLAVFPWLDRAGRRARVHWWATKMLRMFGIALDVQGRFKPGSKLIVANHVSWLDIMVVHAVCPEARFVSKAEVRHWPLIGRLVAAADTLYIERERRRDAMRVVHQCAEALRAGETVAVFPEGTTGPGDALLPFHANLLQAAISVAAPLQPVALRYADRHHRLSPAALWIGDTTMLQTLWLLAGGEGLVARLAVLAPMASDHADRRALAEAARMTITEALARLDDQHPRP